MTMLAHDQTAADAAALIENLQQNASTLPYKILQERLAQASDNLRTLEARRLSAFAAVDSAKAELQSQEAKFLVESGGSLNKANIRQWTDALERQQGKSNTLRGEEARLRQLLEVLTKELAQRNSRHDRAVTDALRDKYVPLVEQKVATARRAVIEALCATAWASGGISPDAIDPSRFCQEILQDHQIRDGVRSFAQAQRADVEKQVQHDRMLG